MSAELKEKVFQYVDSRVTASASEVAKALDITIQRAGRYLKGLVNEGLVEIDHTQDHVPFYSSKSPVRRSNPSLVADEITGKTAEEISDFTMRISQPRISMKANTRDVTEAHAKDTEEVVEKSLDASIKGMVTGAENSGYNKGFTRGYEAGRKESYREAYEDGKRAVLDRLTRLLID